MALKIIIHGITTGFDSNERDTPLFIQSFYNRQKGENYFVAEIVRDGSGVKSCYTLYISRNVSNASNRPGSYFGISLIIDDKVCLDVKALYIALHSTFLNSFAGKVLDKQGYGYRFKIGNFDALGVYVKSVVDSLFAQIENTIRTSLVPIDGSYHLSGGRLTDWNPADLSDNDIVAIIKRDGGIKLSDELPLQAQRKQLEEERMLRQREAEQARIAQEKAEENHRREMARAQKEHRRTEALDRERAIRREQQLIAEARAKADELLRQREAAVRAERQNCTNEINALKAKIAKKEGILREYNDEYKKLADMLERMNARMSDLQTSLYRRDNEEYRKLADSVARISQQIGSSPAGAMPHDGVTSANIDRGDDRIDAVEKTEDSKQNGETKEERGTPHHSGNKSLYFIVCGVLVLLAIVLIILFSKPSAKTEATPQEIPVDSIENVLYDRLHRELDFELKKIRGFAPMVNTGQQGSDRTLANPAVNPARGYPIGGNDYSAANKIKVDISETLTEAGERTVSLQSKVDQAKEIIESLSGSNCKVTVRYPNGILIEELSMMGSVFPVNFKEDGLMTNKKANEGVFNCIVEIEYDFGTFTRARDKSNTFTAK